MPVTQEHRHSPHGTMHVKYGTPRDPKSFTSQDVSSQCTNRYLQHKFGQLRKRAKFSKSGRLMQLFKKNPLRIKSKCKLYDVQGNSWSSQSSVQEMAKRAATRNNMHHASSYCHHCNFESAQIKTKRSNLLNSCAKHATFSGYWAHYFLTFQSSIKYEARAHVAQE